MPLRAAQEWVGKSLSRFARYETQRAFVAMAIRDGSPAYQANILPGDVVLKVNGQPADNSAWRAAVKGDAPMKIELMRNGSMRNVEIVVPPEWKANY